MTAQRVMLVLCVAALGFGAHACLLPSEAGTDLRVELIRVPTLLFPGDTFQLEAAVYDGAGNRVEGLDVGFLHCRLDSVSVYKYGPCKPSEYLDIDTHSGRGRAVRPGLAGVAAYAPGWPGVEFVADTIEVRAGIGAGVEGYWPDEVLFGDTVTIVGDGLDPDSLSEFLVGSISFSASDVVRRFVPGREVAKDTLVLWALPPAVRNGNIVLVRSNGLTSVLPLRIDQTDVLEPNAFTSPRTLPDSFWNPGLALEASNPADWYRIPVSSASGLTLTVHSVGGQPRLTVQRASTQSSIVLGSPEFQCLDRTWSLGAGIPWHERLRVAVTLDSDDEFTVGIENATTGTLVPYALTIEPAYVSAPPPDLAEGNDFCEDAYPLPAAETSLVLNFDNVPDFDWFRLPVAGLQRTTVSAVSTNGADVHPPVYLFAEETSDTVPLAVAAGAEPLEQLLSTGSYLLLVASPGGGAAAEGLEYTLEITSTPVDVAEVQIREDTVVLAGGESVQLAVEVLDGVGDQVSDVPLAWELPVEMNLAVETGGRLTAPGTVPADIHKGWVHVSAPHDPALQDSVFVWLVSRAEVWGVWGTSGADVWMGSSEGGGYLRFQNGVGEYHSLVFGSGAGTYRSVPVEFWGSAPDNMWAAVLGFEIPRGTYQRVDHWIGGVRWEEEANLGDDGRLWGLWGSGPLDVWAVGAQESEIGYVAAVLHSDGGWNRIELGEDRFPGMLLDVWGFGPDDIWAVGSIDSVNPGGTALDGAAVALHYDGTRWSHRSPAAGQPLLGVWGSGPNDVWAVGEGGTILHFDGTWNEIGSPVETRLNGVWGFGPDDVWAVGGSGCSKWWVDDWGGGWNGGCTPAAQGVLLHFDGTEWTPFPVPVSAELKDVWGSAPDDVWAVGGPGIVLHFDGAVWTRLGWEP